MARGCKTYIKNVIYAEKDAIVRGKRHLYTESGPSKYMI